MKTKHISIICIALLLLYLAFMVQAGHGQDMPDPYPPPPLMYIPETTGAILLVISQVWLPVVSSAGLP